VTTLEHVDGLLLTAVGQKVYVWDFKGGKDLIGIAFIDTQLYIHTAVSLKNFVLVADIMKSVSLLRYQEEHKSISLISRVYQLLMFL
jgi:cleavage and polyadenylation specificity factor subunit 1